MKKNVVLVISFLLMLCSIGTFAYLKYQNNEIQKDITTNNENIQKLEDTISNEKDEIDKKEDEYEKLKEKVKDNLEELSIWENVKEKLNNALS